jgi:hypothetical protein
MGAALYVRTYWIVRGGWVAALASNPSISSNQSTVQDLPFWKNPPLPVVRPFTESLLAVQALSAHCEPEPALMTLCLRTLQQSRSHQVAAERATKASLLKTCRFPLRTALVAVSSSRF